MSKYWNIVDYLKDHPITKCGYELGWVETLRKKIIEDLKNPNMDTGEGRVESTLVDLDDVIKIINKRFGVKQ